MIRIGICDDSPIFLKETKSIIDGWDGSGKNIITEVYEDADMLISAHSQNPFDIILLDVVMPILNGIEAAKELRANDKNVKIVFLTSSSEFAVDSYTVKASNYLLKPIDQTRLLTSLSEMISEIQSISKYITVKGIYSAHHISVSDIEYVEAQGKHIVFSLSEGRTIESMEPLYKYEEVLLLEDGFFKCHRSYIVNIHCIDSYSHTEIVMRSGCSIPISRSCQKAFETAYFYVVFGEAGDDI